MRPGWGHRGGGEEPEGGAAVSAAGDSEQGLGEFFAETFVEPLPSWLGGTPNAKEVRREALKRSMQTRLASMRAFEKQAEVSHRDKQ